MQKQTRAYIYALSAIGLWSTVASAFKLTLAETGVIELLFVATMASFLSLLAVAIFRASLSTLRDWPREEWRSSAVLGLLNPFLYYLVLFRAYDLLPAQEAQPLNYTWPIVLVLLSALILRQPLRGRSVVAMLISFGGVAVISTRGEVFALRFTNVEGVALAVGSSLIWSLYWIYTMRSAADPLLKLGVNFLFGSVYVAILAIASGALLRLTDGAVFGGVYVGLFEMGITFMLWMKALELTSTTARIGNLVFLSPFLSLMIIHLVVGEEIYPSTPVGLLLIVGGIILEKIGREGPRGDISRRTAHR
ncbi:MAG: DMT family transporter [Bacteroidota bacterium]|nr:DMT family transporter [Bacteroidota bacterium]